MSLAGRAAHIVATALRYRIDELALRLLPAAQQPLWLRLSPLRALPTPREPAPVRLRLALESLGPVFIKFGQILSTRRDLLSPEFAEQLAKLQDQVPPFDPDAARDLIAESLGASFDSVFARFDREPLAAASIAQVHAGALVSGEEVIIKVVRPDIEPVIRRDVALLRRLARFIDRAVPEAGRLRLPEVVDDYERTILAELDLELEAASTQRLRENFAGSHLLYVPRVYHRFSSRNVLVAERIHGVPVAEVDRLRAAGTDMKKLAERGVETFFTQVFEHNFFHADMHPGNVFVDVTDPAEPRYIALDCAIMGSLTETDQAYLARNLVAFFHRDYAEVARLHVASGWVPPDTDPRAFETVIAEVCEPIFSKPLAEISFGSFLVALFNTARRFDMQIQPQLVLLQKTLLAIEGLGRQLYPELDLWETAAPFMERWVAERMGPAAQLQRLAERMPELLTALARLPDTLASTEQRLARLDARLSELETLQRRAAGRSVVGRRLTGGALLVAAFALILAGEPGHGIGGGVLALAGSYLAFGR